MILLNFDTALNKTYVAISNDGNLLTSKIVENTAKEQQEQAV